MHAMDQHARWQLARAPTAAPTAASIIVLTAAPTRAARFGALGEVVGEAEVLRDVLRRQVDHVETRVTKSVGERRLLGRGWVGGVWWVVDGEW